MAGDNPFERYELDPCEGVAAITLRLKELAEEASDDAERERIRAAWEELTLHPARRLRAALHAHPETRAPLGSPPVLPRPRVAPTELKLRDLAARPSAVAALCPRPTRPCDAAHDGPVGPVLDVEAPPLWEDPLF